MATAAGPRTASRKPRMRKIGDGRYLVESTSTPGLGHQVDVVRGRCGCRASQFGRRCHHLDWAERLDFWFRTQQALMQAERAKATPARASQMQMQIARPSGMVALAEAFVN